MMILEVSGHFTEQIDKENIEDTPLRVLARANFNKVITEIKEISKFNKTLNG